MFNIFWRKKGSQFDRKKQMEAKMEERELFFVSYISNIYYLLNNIIDWIDLILDHY